MTIKRAQCDEVLRLAGEGLNVKRISRITGIHRMSIYRILDGRLLQRPGPKPSIGGATRVVGLFDMNKTERCPTCGGLVVMPCKLCEARSHHPIIAEQRASQSGETDDVRSARHSSCRRGGVDRAS